MCFALIFALRRNLLAYVEDTRNGVWNKSSQFCFLTHPIRDIAGSTLGIVGYGALGKSIGKRAEALGMKVLPFDVVPQAGPGRFRDDPQGERHHHAARAAHAGDQEHDRREGAQEDEADRHPHQHGARRPGR